MVSKMLVTPPVPFSVAQFYGYRTPRNYTGKRVDVLGRKKGRTQVGNVPAELCLKLGFVNLGVLTNYLHTQSIVHGWPQLFKCAIIYVSYITAFICNVEVCHCIYYLQQCGNKGVLILSKMPVILTLPSYCVYIIEQTTLVLDFQCAIFLYLQ